MLNRAGGCDSRVVLQPPPTIQLSPPSTMSDEEADTSVELEPYQTQFVPPENDDEKLWDVIEILAERGKRYRVKWAGNDPSTGKPWAPSWVLKQDCTDDLIYAWKIKQAQKKKQAEKRKASMS